MQIGRLAWAVVAVAVTGCAAPVASATPSPNCPFGQHEDTQTSGFQCVPGWCPPGTLLDGVTGSCVTAPGVPPPPLPGSLAI